MGMFWSCPEMIFFCCNEAMPVLELILQALAVLCDIRERDIFAEISSYFCLILYMLTSLSLTIYDPNRKSVSEISSNFDSIYISFYKGLGGISGAMLLGNAEFCAEARKWLRRFGGNLKTLMPYAVSCWSAYRCNGVDHHRIMSLFSDRRKKLQRIVETLSNDSTIKNLVRFDPEVPETNMVHLYLKASIKKCEAARDVVEKNTGVIIFRRIHMIAPSEHVAKLGFLCRVEWVLGDANGSIDEDVFLHGMKEFTACVSLFTD